MNEALLITQVIEISGKSYAFLIPMGATYQETYAALSEFLCENKNKEKEQQKAQELEAKKLQEEMNNAKGEAVKESQEA